MHANPTDDQEIQTTLALIECVTILSVWDDVTEFQVQLMTTD
jgi:hypothetical protein